MKKFKRLIALVTVAMFILSFAAPTFAADATDDTTAAAQIIGADVVGTKYEAPSKKLISLGVINGFTDGTIRPESEVTRAQFAAIVAKELGLGDVSPSPTKFKDVPATHWASGAINLAVGQGIIVGYPDGTFRPDQQVTFAEASAMLVQMLGYGPALKDGVWPATPISMAAQIGVSKGVSLAANAKTPRGEVIIMAANALTADIMEQTTWGTDQYWTKKDNKNLLYTIFDIEVKNKDADDIKTEWNDKMPTVDNTPRFDLAGLKADEIQFKSDAKTYTLNYYFDANAFMNEEVEVWVNKDDKKVYYIGPSDNQTVINDRVADWDTDSTPRIKLDKKDKWYDILDDTTAVLVNLKKSPDTMSTWGALKSRAATLNDFKNADVKVILNDKDKVTTIIITDYYSDEFTTESGFVTEVNADKESIGYIDAYGDDDVLNLDDADYAIVRNGIQANVKDLKADDVLNILKDGNDKVFIFATANKVTGKVEKSITSSDTDLTKFDIYIDGKKYDVTEEITFSDDSNDTVTEASADDLYDLVGKNATLLLDAQGKVKHVVTDEVTESGKLYGVLVKTPQTDGAYDEVKLTFVNKSGVEQVFTFDYDDVKVYGDSLTNVSDNKFTTKAAWATNFAVTGSQNNTNPILIEYKLDSNGKLSEVRKQRVDDGISPKTQYETLVSKANVKIDTSENAIDLVNGSFKVTDKTVIWDAHNWDGTKIKDLKKVSWASLDDRTVSVLAKTKNAEVEYMIIFTTDKALGESGKFGIVMGTTKKGGDPAVVIRTVDGDKTYVWDEATVITSTQYVYDRTISDKASIAKGDFVYYSLSGEGDDAEIDEIAVVAAPGKLSYPIAVPDDQVAADKVRVDYIKVVKAISGNLKGYAIADATDGISDSQESFYVLNSDTKWFDISDTADLKTTSGANRDDLVILIDTDDDGSTPDYAIIVAEDYTK